MYLYSQSKIHSIFMSLTNLRYGRQRSQVRIGSYLPSHMVVKINVLFFSTTELFTATESMVQMEKFIQIAEDMKKVQRMDFKLMLFLKYRLSR